MPKTYQDYTDFLAGSQQQQAPRQQAIRVGQGAMQLAAGWPMMQPLSGLLPGSPNPAFAFGLTDRIQPWWMRGFGRS